MKKLLLTLSSIIAFQFANAQCNELFISEYVEGYNNNKALEIYNPKSTSVDLSNYRLIRWSNGSTTSDADIKYVQSLSGTIQPQSTFTFFLDKRDSTATAQDTILESTLLAIANNMVSAGTGAFYSPVYDANTEGANMMPFNGDDAISIQKNTGGWTNVDIFGVIGERPTNGGGTFSPSGGWTDTPPYNDGIGAYLTKDKTLKRQPGITSGITNNPGFFNALSEWDSLTAGTYSYLGAHTCVCNTGINEINFSNKVLVSPNPSEGIFTINNSGSEIYHLFIYNPIGEIVNQLSNVKDSEIVINLNTLPKGIYFLKTQSVDKVEVQKIILR